MRITRPKTQRGGCRGVTLRRDAFTLLEVTAVIFIISILVSLLCAALNHTKSKALRISCFDNVKQLQQAWWLYAADNGESLPLNQTSFDAADPRFPQAQSSKESWVTGNPLQDLSTDSVVSGTLFPYVGSVGVYHCPTDDSTVPRHPEVPRTRSYSMNSYLGGDTNLNPAPKFKFAEITRPDNAFVFIEEHELSRWHTSFLVPSSDRTRGTISAASSAVWLSVPADRHAQGCNISFADGHTEYWRWYAPKGPTDLDSQSGSVHAAGVLSPTPQIQDFMRLQSCLP